MYNVIALLGPNPVPFMAKHLRICYFYCEFYLSTKCGKPPGGVRRLWNINPTVVMTLITCCCPHTWDMWAVKADPDLLYSKENCLSLPCDYAHAFSEGLCCIIIGVAKLLQPQD